MRVHIVATRADQFGGAEVYTVGLARELALLGHEVTIVCHEPGSADGRPYNVTQIPRADCAWPVIWRFAHWSQWLSYRRPIQTLPGAPPDVIICMAHLLSYWYWKRYPRTPMVYLPHSLVAPKEVASCFRSGSIQQRTSILLWKRLELLALRRATCTVRFSSFAKHELQQHYGESRAERILVWPPPVDTPKNHQLPTLREGLRLLYVGRLIATKNLGLTLDALSELPVTAEWRLDIVGDGPLMSSLSRRVHEDIALDGRVEFHGRQDDVSRFYDDAHLLVFPSMLESAGLVVIEAMSHGVPALVIRSDGVKYLSSCAEFIDNDRTGFVAANEEDYRAVLAELVRTPHRVLGACENARELFLQRHTWQNHAVLWQGLLGDLERRAGHPS